MGNKGSINPDPSQLASTLLDENKVAEVKVKTSTKRRHEPEWLEKFKSKAKLINSMPYFVRHMYN